MAGDATEVMRGEWLVRTDVSVVNTSGRTVISPDPMEVEEEFCYRGFGEAVIHNIHPCGRAGKPLRQL